jgi:acyl carrier protein
MEGTPLSGKMIENWMISNLSELLAVAPEEIDVNEPFSRLGLDSAAAVGLIGDLEHLLDRSLSPTLAYDHPTISALAQHLGGEGK